MATWRTDVNPHTVKMLQCAGYVYVIGQKGEIRPLVGWTMTPSQQVEDGEKCSPHLSFVTSTHHMSESHTSYQ